MKNYIYTLSSDYFVGGQTETYAFRLKKKSGEPFNASGCQGVFSLIDYSFKEDDPILIKSLTFVTGEMDIIDTALVTLDREDTLYLNGKYIYQLSIRDTAGNVEVPNQGLFYISNNINKSF